MQESKQRGTVYKIYFFFILSFIYFYFFNNIKCRDDLSFKLPNVIFSAGIKHHDAIFFFFFEKQWI